MADEGQGLGRRASVLACAGFVVGVGMLAATMPKVAQRCSPEKPPSSAVSDGPAGEPRGDCPPAPPCEIIGEHEIGSAWATAHGVLRGAEGVTCDEEILDCGSEPLPITALVETSKACGLLSGFYAKTATKVYIVRPQSVGDSGGSGHGLMAIEGAEPESFRPLPRGFGRDATGLFDHGTRVLNFARWR